MKNKGQANENKQLKNNELSIVNKRYGEKLNYGAKRGILLLIKCHWKTCVNYKKGICKASVIELESFDYEEEHEELEGLKCSSYKYDYFWMCDNGREVDVRG